MIYLILQILFCLIIAFLLGLLIGWILGRQPANNRKEHKNINTNGTISHYAPPPINVDKTKELSKKASKPSKVSAPPVTPQHAATITNNKPSNANSATAKLNKVTSKKANQETNKIQEVDLFGKGYEIETLEGVGPKTGQALRAINIATVGDFIKKAGTEKSRSDIAKKISVRPKMVDSWASMADLLRIDGVDHQSAELMHASGITRTSELAKQKPSDFIAKMTKINNAGKRSIAPEIPSEANVNSWISKANSLKTEVQD